jgi:hypothetical protein
VGRKGVKMKIEIQKGNNNTYVQIKKRYTSGGKSVVHR